VADPPEATEFNISASIFARFRLLIIILYDMKLNNKLTILVS